MGNSNRSSRRRPDDKFKPPRPDFPLRVHKGTGYWCKKIRGHVQYFGKVADDPKGVAAEEEYDRIKGDLKAGRQPPPKASEELLLGDLCNQFLAAKENSRDNDEIHARTFWGYHATCKNLCDRFGRDKPVAAIGPADFRDLRKSLAKKRKAVALGNEIMRVRSVFKFGKDEGLILQPVLFGQAFSKPSQEVLDRQRNDHRQKHGVRMYEPPEIRAILAACGQPLKPMVLLAANCGFGQSDISALPINAVNLETGWVDFARVKTAIQRRIPLWPETVEAIREWLPQRPKPKDKADAGLLFLTVRGGRWVKLNATGSPCDALGHEFAKLIKKLKLERNRRSFYAFRHGFQTIGDEVADPVATSVLMGHKIKGMARHYIERIGDDRLVAVVEHVRKWLFENRV